MNKIKELRTQMKNITKKMTYLTFCVNKRGKFQLPEKAFTGTEGIYQNYPK